ncbi:MAG: M23 family metallopeptidase [Eubacteriales bacterium]
MRRVEINKGPGSPFEKDEWLFNRPRSQWREPVRPGKGGGRSGNLYRLAAAVLIFLAFFALKENASPWGIQARETLKRTITTDWDYRPALEKIAQYGLTLTELDWPAFTVSHPAVTRQQKSLIDTELPLPVSGKIVRGYGMVLDPLDDMERFHPGIDIAAPVGSAVKAVKDGRVTRVGDGAVLGKFVLLEHEQGSYTLYGELARAMVVEGQIVPAGQSIGEVGVTGDISGGGLHFEIRENNKLVDPLTRLRTVQ